MRTQVYGKFINICHHRMTAVYGRIHTALNGWQLPVSWLQYLIGLIHADTVTGTVLRAPYVQPIQDMADSPNESGIPMS